LQEKLALWIAEMYFADFQSFVKISISGFLPVFAVTESGLELTPKYVSRD